MLSDPAYRPVMEELDRRNAVVFVHPTAANCCKGLNYAMGVHPSSMEYGTDTTRAITGIVINGYANSFPNIRWIWSHGGGSMPFLAGRIAGSRQNEQMPNGFIYELERFYYDLAGASNRGAVASLLELVRADHILFGTDFPPGGTMEEYARRLRELDMFSEGDLRLDRARERGRASAAVRGVVDTSTPLRSDEEVPEVFPQLQSRDRPHRGGGGWLGPVNGSRSVEEGLRVPNIDDSPGVLEGHYGPCGGCRVPG